MIKNLRIAESIGGKEMFEAQISEPVSEFLGFENYRIQEEGRAVPSSDPLSILNMKLTYDMKYPRIWGLNC